MANLGLLMPFQHIITAVQWTSDSLCIYVARFDRLINMKKKKQKKVITVTLMQSSNI